MNWDEIDSIKREVPQTKPFERRKIQPSVEKILLDFDNKFKQSKNLTEADFHKGNEKVMVIQERNYIQKALRKTLRWQQFCQTNL